jgi:predicted nucleotidyltransferase
VTRVRVLQFRLLFPPVLRHNAGMTRKIRNTGRTIDVSAHMAALERLLGEVLGLVAAYLYGSYGTPYQTPLSDVDIALVFKDGDEPSPEQHVELIGRVSDTLQEDDVSVTVLNTAPLAFQHRVLAEGRAVLIRDEIAHADFLERTTTRYCDFAIDEARFFEEYDRALAEEYSCGAG